MLRIRASFYLPLLSRSVCAGKLVRKASVVNKRVLSSDGYTESKGKLEA